MVACIAPFLAGPRAQIGYSLGGRSVSENLALPIVAPKFCTPPDAPVAKEAFFQRWRAVEGAPIDALCLCLAEAGIWRSTVQTSYRPMSMQYVQRQESCMDIGG